jgi:hypothetical protein
MISTSFLNLLSEDEVELKTLDMDINMDIAVYEHREDGTDIEWNDICYKQLRNPLNQQRQKR